MMKAVIFDVDGVLLDSDEKIVDAFEDVGEVLGLKSPGRDFFRKSLGIPFREILLQAYGDSQEAVDIFRKAEEELDPELMDGMEDVVEKIRVLKGIVSTKESRLVRKFLSKVIDEFDVVIGGDDTERHKPDPEPLLLACKRLGVDPADVLYVGDMVRDYEMARDAGARFIAFVSSGSTEEEFREAGVETIAHSMKELDAILQA